VIDDRRARTVSTKPAIATRAAAVSATADGILPAGRHVFSYRLGSGPSAPTFTYV
jgi:hypothetical protein